MKIDELSDQQVLALLGERLKKARLQCDFTQEQLAERAGLGFATIHRLEQGKGRLDSVVAVLRELNLLGALDSFIPDVGLSPLQLARAQGKVRQRASGKTGVADDEVQSEW